MYLYDSEIKVTEFRERRIRETITRLEILGEIHGELHANQTVALSHRNTLANCIVIYRSVWLYE